MSPNSGRVLNLFTPSFENQKSEAPEVIGLEEEQHMQKQGIRLILKDAKNNECLEIGTMQQEDDNNNIITTKIHDLSKEKLTL